MEFSIDHLLLISNHISGGVLGAGYVLEMHERRAVRVGLISNYNATLHFAEFEGFNTENEVDRVRVA